MTDVEKPYAEMESCSTALSN